VAIFQFDMTSQFSGRDPYHTIIHIGNTSTTLEQATLTADEILNLWNTHLTPIQSLEWNATSVTLRNVSVAGMPALPAVGLTSILPSGDVAGNNPVALQAQGYISWRSYTTRPNRGGNYIPCIAETYSEAGRPNGTALNALTNFANGIIAIGEIGHPELDDPVYSICIARFGETPPRVTMANRVTAFRVKSDFWANLNKRRD